MTPEITPSEKQTLLSQRQLAVLVGLSQNLTRAEIAAQLRIAPGTIPTYIKEIRNRLMGQRWLFRTRLPDSELVEIARNHGLLPPIEELSEE